MDIVRHHYKFMFDQLHVFPYGVSFKPFFQDNISFNIMNYLVILYFSES